jgi:hypothetical protein
MTNKPKKPVTETVAPVATEEVIHSIKGFGLDWKCLDFQFEAGNTYEITGPIVACETGFHAIEGNPIEVFGYYAPGQSRYAEVKQSGAFSRDANDGKLASAKITIGVEIKVHDLVERAVKWVVSKCVAAGSNHAEGDQSAASSTGYRSAASSTGNQSAASSTGDRSAASSTGDQSAASSTGNQSAASSTGDRSAASSTGYQSAASSTGDRSAAMSSGRFGKVMGKKGNALFLVYRDDDFNIVHAWAGIAGSDGIKADTWYCLDAEGKPEEIK